MTPEQKQLVRDSFAKLGPIADDAAALFYQRLFTLDPKLRALFTHDLKEQGRKLMSMIATAVAQLDKVEVLVPVLRELGKRHVGYGVRDSDYDTVATHIRHFADLGIETFMLQFQPFEAEMRRFATEVRPLSLIHI